jgi:hypothetical protein
MRPWLLLLLCIYLPVQASEPRLPELRMAYATTWNGIKLGEVIVSLKPGEGADCYHYESQSNPVGMVRMFYGKPREVSEFCIRKGRVVPQRFSFVNPADEADNFTLNFDLAAGKVMGGVGERDIPANAQDRFGLQQAVRLWVIQHAGKNDKETVEFAMVDDDRIKTYRFAITAYEEVEVPAGKFETVLVQRVDDPRKTSKFWLAPSRDYMPVKVEQVKSGDSELRMVLK